jgi:hypothetical protein
VDQDSEFFKKLFLVSDHQERRNKQNDDDHDENQRKIGSHRHRRFSDLFRVLRNDFARMLDCVRVLMDRLNAFFHVRVHLFNVAASSDKKNKED